MPYIYDDIFYVLNDSAKLKEILKQECSTLDDVLTRYKLSKKSGCDNVFTAKKNGKERLIFTMVDCKLILLDEMVDHRYNRLNVMNKQYNRALLREILGEENRLVKVNVVRGDDDSIKSLSTGDVDKADDLNLVHFVQGKFITNNERQKNIILKSLGRSHQLVVGGPGSGKTLTIGQIAKDERKTLYIAKESNLVSKFKEDFSKQEGVDCISWDDFVGVGENVPKHSYSDFRIWVTERLNAKGEIGNSLVYIKKFWQVGTGYKKNLDIEKFISNLYEELRIITGYNSDEYKGLGIRQKLFWHDEKGKHLEISQKLLYVFEQYNLNLERMNVVDISLYIPEQAKIQRALEGYERVLFDESQDISRGPLKVFFTALNDINLQGEIFCQATICFDNQQSMTDTITSLPYIESCFNNVETHHLSESYRSSGDILLWANNCLRVKNIIAGGIDGKGDYLSIVSSEAVSASSVTVIGEDNKCEIEKLTELLGNTEDVVVITPNSKMSEKARTKDIFNKSIIYTAEEAKGLEFSTVIQYGFFNSQDPGLKRINSNFSKGKYCEDVLSRSKDKNSLSKSSSLDFHKLFVSSTRAIDKLIIVDDVSLFDSFKDFGAKLKEGLQVSSVIELANSKESLPNLSDIELIEAYLVRINEVSSMRSDDIRRGIVVNQKTFDKIISSLEHSLQKMLDAAVCSSESETLWGLTRLTGVLSETHLNRLLDNEHVIIDMLLAIASITTDASAFSKIYREVDKVRTQEDKLDCLTKLLKIFAERSRLLSAKEFRGIILAIKSQANSLFSILISTSVKSRASVCFSESEFVDTDIISQLSEGSANPDIIGEILSNPVANERVVLSIVNNTSFSLEFICDKLRCLDSVDSNKVLCAIDKRRQEEISDDVNIYTARLLDKDNKSNNGIDLSVGLENSKRQKQEAVSVNKEKASEEVLSENKKSRKDKTISDIPSELEGHATVVSDLLCVSFKEASDYLTSEQVVKCAGSILLEKVNGSNIILLRKFLEEDKLNRTCYLESVVAANKDKTFDDAFLETVTVQSSHIRLWASQGCINLIKLALSRINNYLKLDKLVNYRSKTAPDTALMIASNLGHVEIVEYLLSKGASHNLCNPSGENAAMRAAANGHIKVLDVFKKFLSKEDFIEFINGGKNNKLNALVYAVVYSQFSTITYLLKNNSSCNITFNNGDNLSLYVARKGDVKRLLAFKSGMSEKVFNNFINCADDRGTPPIICALLNNNMIMCQFLLRLGARYDAVDANGSNVITCAMVYFRTPDTFAELAKKLSNNQLLALLSMEDKKGKKPWHYLTNKACFVDFISVIKDRENYKDLVSDAAHYASENGYTKNLQLIIERIPDRDNQRFAFVNETLEGYQHNLLSVATLNGQEEAQRYLSSIEENYEHDNSLVNHAKLKPRV